MKLKKISISNYRSIDLVEIKIEPIQKSNTITFIGENESGKSNILKGISLISDSVMPEFPLDYYDNTKKITVAYHYEFEDSEVNDLKDFLTQKYAYPEEILDKIKINKLTLTKEFDNKNVTIAKIVNGRKTNSTVSQVAEKNIVDFDIEDIFTNKFNIGTNNKVQNTESFQKVNVKDHIIKITLEYLWEKQLNIIFWNSSSEYQLRDSVSLDAFKKNPIKTSIPLTNCLSLYGIKENEISKFIVSLKTEPEITNFEDKLSDLVSDHINKIWKKHPIKLRFKLRNNFINTLVIDEKVKHKSKTIKQRSDGFRQFISFILTISVDKKVESLKNFIILLDEPEIHLHPAAQIDLFSEFLEITNSSLNNYLFYATHSLFLIDKKNLNRSIKVFKRNNESTNIKPINKRNSTIAEITYEVYGISTTDYHNELYGKLEVDNKQALNNLPKNKIWIRHPNNRETNVSQTEYIRHSIHHPENNLNRKYTYNQLESSIKKMRQILEIS